MILTAILKGKLRIMSLGYFNYPLLIFINKNFSTCVFRSKNIFNIFACTNWQRIQYKIFRLEMFVTLNFI